MAAKTEKDPNEVVHLQVNQGSTAHFQGKAFGDRATIQVRRGDRDQVDGNVEEVNPQRLPDVGERPSVPPPESRKP